MPKKLMIYDDSCGFCSRSKRFIEKLDSKQSLQWIGISKFNYKKHKLDKKDFLKEIHLIDSNKRIHKGYFAFKKASKTIPFLYAFYLLSLVPGIDFLGDFIYKQITKNRHRL